MDANTMAAPACIGDVSLMAEAQRLMTSSIKKIVTSRTRRGGVSLHRNLLVAGVLFKARDVLLAASNMTSAPLSVSGSPLSEEQLETMDVEDKRKSDVLSQSLPASVSLKPETVVEDSSIPAPISGSDRVNFEITGKENVPPSSTTTPDFADPPMETNSPTSADSSIHLVSACVRKRRHSATSLTTHPIVVKSSKISTSRCSASSSSSSSALSHSPSSISSAAAPRPTIRPTSSKSPAPVSLSTCSGRGRICVNPIVYVNRINVEFCSTSGIGSGSVRPIFVVQVV